MTPQEIAREAAEAIRHSDSLCNNVEGMTALILTAAAKMVRESGAVEALQFYAFDDNYRLNGYLDPNGPNFRGSNTARRALQSLRAIGEPHQGDS